MVDNAITNAESTESKEVQLYNKFKEVMGISPAFGMYNKEKEYMLYKEIVEDLGRILIMDGTHVSTYRPEESMERRFRYSGKKKSFTFNTNLMITGYGLIIFKSKTVNGSTHDMTLLKEDMPDFDKLCSLLGHKTMWLFVDRGYQGIQKLIDCMNIMIPYKKQKNSKQLTQEEYDYNRMVGSIRIMVENAMARIKQHARMAGRYRNTIDDFGQDLNIATGLANFHLMWDDIKKGRYELGQSCTSSSSPVTTAIA